MATKDEALKLALEALELVTWTNNPPVNKAITAVREALAEQPAQQEPFGYFRYDLRLDAWVQNRAGLTGTPFYTSPPAQRTWVGLTYGEVLSLRKDDPLQFYKAIEAKLKEKNNG
jgi:hypothetical protein